MDTQKPKKEKPKYNILQNFCFLAKSAWKLEKGCVLFPAAKEMLALILQLVELFVAPVILSKIEQQVPLSEFLGIIGIFTVTLLLIAGLDGYFVQMNNRADGRLRLNTMHRINHKACTTAYENTVKKDYLDLIGQANYYIASTMVFGFSIHFLGALAGFGIYLFLLTTKLPLLLLGISVLTALMGYMLNKRVNRWQFERRQEVKSSTGRTYYVDNTIMNNEMSKDIRMFGLGNWLMELWNEGFTLYMNYVKRRELRLLAVNLAGVLLTLLRNAFAYAYLIHLVLTEGLSASEFLLLFTAAGGFTQWVITLLDSLAEIQDQSLNLCQLREYLEYPEPFAFEEAPAVPRADEYTLTLENVTYRYPNTEKPTIDNLNFTLKPGEKVAIVGLNGAGKTTLVKLLCGFLDPTEGCVLLNGEDIRQYNRRDYYQLFSAVFQEFSILAATVAANVAQTEENIDYERVAECLDKAGLTEMVAELPEGAENHLRKIIRDDGIELSGGQTQRLMLARALYKNAPVLVLDEPTAALDPLAESDIYRKYDSMSKGRSSIFISHRLASTQFCDRVLFLSEGKIAEEGTHEELLKNGAGYAELFEVQARYYKEGEVDTWQE